MHFTALIYNFKKDLNKLEKSNLPSPLKYDIVYLAWTCLTFHVSRLNHATYWCKYTVLLVIFLAGVIYLFIVKFLLTSEIYENETSPVPSS